MSDRFVLGTNLCPSWADGASESGAALHQMARRCGGPFKLLLVCAAARREEFDAFFADGWPEAKDFSSVSIEVLGPIDSHDEGLAYLRCHPKGQADLARIWTAAVAARMAT